MSRRAPGVRARPAGLPSEGRCVPLDRLDDGQLAILRAEAGDWLVAKAEDLPRVTGDAGAAGGEVQEVAALGRLVAGLRRGEMVAPDPAVRELVARSTGELDRLGELEEEYSRALARHGSGVALLAHLDRAPDAGAEEGPGSPGVGGPVASVSGRVDLAGRLSDDQLRILREEVTDYLVARACDLGLLHQSPESGREIGEVAALGRLASWLGRGEVEVPDRIAREMVVRLAEPSEELEEWEELRERYEAGTARRDALLAFEAILSGAPPASAGPEGHG